jgi:hypothetical protein
MSCNKPPKILQRSSTFLSKRDHAWPSSISATPAFSWTARQASPHNSRLLPESESFRLLTWLLCPDLSRSAGFGLTSGNHMGFNFYWLEREFAPRPVEHKLCILSCSIISPGAKYLFIIYLHKLNSKIWCVNFLPFSLRRRLVPFCVAVKLANIYICKHLFDFLFCSERRIAFSTFLRPQN